MRDFLRMGFLSWAVLLLGVAGCFAAGYVVWLNSEKKDGEWYAGVLGLFASAAVVVLSTIQGIQSTAEAAEAARQIGAAQEAAAAAQQVANEAARRTGRRFLTDEGRRAIGQIPGIDTLEHVEVIWFPGDSDGDQLSRSIAAAFSRPPWTTDTRSKHELAPSEVDVTVAGPARKQGICQQIVDAIALGGLTAELAPPKDTFGDAVQISVSPKPWMVSPAPSK